MPGQDLTPNDLKELKENVQAALEKHSCELHPLEHRNHLGISEIGEPCSRKTWYKFRWFSLEYHEGRMRRLFARGHREEHRYISYLEGIGAKTFQHDTNGNQFRVSGVMGHYGGSCDGVAYLPWYPDIPFLLEFKTHNDKSFAKYLSDGVMRSKPKHYDQMCGYGVKMEIRYALYWPENKNDDSIIPTVLKLDWQRGNQLEAKAHDIINSQVPPPRISDNPAFKDCKYCFLADHCHRGKAPDKNCRSCKFAVPTENAQWRCEQHNDIIPNEFILKACDQWMPI